jgi:hypothetical protein
MTNTLRSIRTILQKKGVDGMVILWLILHS